MYVYVHLLLNNMEKESLPLPVSEVLERVGEFIQSWGFRKLDGQVWTLIFLSSEALTATQIAKQLNMSKASVSLSINELLEFKVIREVAHGKHRSVYYDTTLNMADVIQDVLRNRERRMMAQMLTDIKLLERSSEEGELADHVNSKRVQELRLMMEGAESMLSAAFVMVGQICPFKEKELKTKPEMGELS